MSQRGKWYVTKASGKELVFEDKAALDVWLNEAKRKYVTIESDENRADNAAR